MRHLRRRGHADTHLGASHHPRRGRLRGFGSLDYPLILFPRLKRADCIATAHVQEAAAEVCRTTQGDVLLLPNRRERE